MSAVLNFTSAVRKKIRERAGDVCEIHGALDAMMEGMDMPKDFPKIDLNNPLHTQLEAHHANFKSTSMPGINEAWNGVWIYKFYHDIIHGHYGQYQKWAEIIAKFCRQLAESRRPFKSTEEVSGDRIERHAEKLEKNSEKRAKAKQNRKENPWILNRPKKEVPQRFQKEKPKKFTKPKLTCFFNRQTGKLENIPSS